MIAPEVRGLSVHPGKWRAARGLPRPSASIIRSRRNLRGTPRFEAARPDFHDNPVYGPPPAAVALCGGGSVRARPTRAAGLIAQVGLVGSQGPKRNTSKAGIPEHKVSPYLCAAERATPGEPGWAADITYIPMPARLLYLVRNNSNWATDGLLVLRLFEHGWRRAGVLWSKAVERRLAGFGKPGILQ